jgi:subtilase family serine protease
MRTFSSAFRAFVGVLLAGLFLAVSAGAQQKLRLQRMADAEQEVQFDVYLPLQHESELDELLVKQNTPGSANYHHWLTPDEFRRQFGPNENDMVRIADQLRQQGLEVTSTHSHGLCVEGPVKAVERAFDVQLWEAIAPNGHLRLAANRALSLPAVMTEANARVVEFSSTIRHQVVSKKSQLTPANRYSNVGPYWYDDLKQAYDFPSYQVFTGKGRTIAVVEASDYLESDIDAYFSFENLAPPKIVRQVIDGGAPFDPNSGASLEAALDLEQAGGMAPGATLAIYIIPDLSDAEILNAYETAIETNQADIVSSSFIGPEGFYTAAYNGGTDFTYILRTFEDVFKQGNAQGITFVAASGDNGALDLPSLDYFTTPPQNPPVVAGKFLPGIGHPASSPSVTAVGGTNLVTTFNPPSLESKYVSENAYADPLEPYDPYGVGNLLANGVFGSGGGKSIVFARPLYQSLVNTGSNTRTIPDVSLQMGGCPIGAVQPCGPNRSAVIVALAGAFYGAVGTSVSAPDFSGLLALEEQNVRSRLGNVNYQVYLLAAAQFNGLPVFPVYHQDIPGFDGFYSTHNGYDLVLGNGTLFGKDFILAPFVPPAENPRTPSNP